MRWCGGLSVEWGLESYYGPDGCAVVNGSLSLDGRGLESGRTGPHQTLLSQLCS
jgi:hypothetical protein